MAPHADYGGVTQRLRLLPIAGPSSGQSSIIDVVFVHGLSGDGFSTWVSPSGSDQSWLEWLAVDIPQVNFWSLDYPADFTKWTTQGKGMDLASRGKSVLALLVNLDLGRRPLVFVGHSLGGLVAKQVLRLSAELRVPDWDPIAEATVGLQLGCSLGCRMPPICSDE